MTLFIVLFATINIAIGYGLAVYLGRVHSPMLTKKVRLRRPRPTPTESTPDPVTEHVEAAETTQPDAEASKQDEPEKDAGANETETSSEILGAESETPVEEVAGSIPATDEVSQTAAEEEPQAEGSEPEAVESLASDESQVEEVAESDSQPEQQSDTDTPAESPDSAADASPPKESAAEAEEPVNDEQQKLSKGEKALSDIESIRGQIDSMKQEITLTEDAPENEPVAEPVS